MKLAAAYIRVSTDDQIEYSPESQLKSIREYAKHHDFIVPDDYVFIDEGISGKNTKKRPEFNRMIGIAKSKPKPFDAILLWKFSRFARNREDSIVYKSMLRKQLGIEVISISEALGDDKMSVLIEALIEAMDEYYSINLAEEVKRGMTEKASRGEPLTIAPFGYRMEQKQLVVHPQESQIVQMIFQEFLNGHGMRELATTINAMGIRTHRGNLFENRTIEYILNNPVYIGKIRWNPTGKTRRDYHNENVMIVDGTHTPIISTELWENVQKYLCENKQIYRRRDRSTVSNNLFQGILKCGNCGKSLSLSRKGYLQCIGYSHGQCTVSHTLKYDTAHRIILNQIQKDLISGNIHITQKRQNMSDQSMPLIYQIKNEYTKLERVKAAYENGIDTISEYQNNKQRISTTIQALEQKLASLKTQKPKETLVAELRQTYHNAIDIIQDEAVPTSEKNRLLRSFIDKIVYDKKKNQLQIFYFA